MLGWSQSNYPQSVAGVCLLRQNFLHKGAHENCYTSFDEAVCYHSWRKLVCWMTITSKNGRIWFRHVFCFLYRLIVYNSDVFQQQLLTIFAVVRNSVHVYVQLVFCRHAHLLDTTRDWFGTDEGLDIIMDVYKILGFEYTMSLSLDSLIAAQVVCFVVAICYMDLLQRHTFLYFCCIQYS